MEIINKLFELEDKKYAEFQCKLIPNIDRDKIIGVRVPKVRNLAKNYIKDEESKIFLNTLPHKFYDENMLHGLLISEIKDYDTCIKEIDKFLPYIDNWAVCDIMSPKIFKNNKDKLINKIKQWTKSKETYICRFGIDMLMSNYLDESFKKEYLEIPAKIQLDEYYVQMAIAWFFATALAKKWDETIPYIKQNKLEKFVHNKTIQKAKESFRISKEQKQLLNTLKK